MRVFVAGSTGVVGRRLVPLLVSDGHEVTGLTRDPAKREQLERAGATAVIADALDADSLTAAVVEARPDVVVHQLTSLSGDLDVRRFARTFAATNALRTTGTDHLLAAARAAGARRLVAQSFAGWPYARTGGPVKSEADPLDADPPGQMRTTLAAIRHLERAVTGATDVEGVVLRYGGFYGPGTSLGPDGGQAADLMRRRRWPIVGGGTGVWSFVHVDDVAGATAAAVRGGAPGVYNVVDDDPAPVRDWAPYLAGVLGAKPPRRVPAWIGRLAAGEHAVAMMTTVRGASNAKAKRELDWTLAYPSWRQGFTTLR